MTLGSRRNGNQYQHRLSLSLSLIFLTVVHCEKHKEGKEYQHCQKGAFMAVVTSATRLECRNRPLD